MSNATKTGGMDFIRYGEPQEHIVTVSVGHEAAMSDWIDENCRCEWSYRRLWNDIHPEKEQFEVSFADLETAILFRLRF